MKHVCEKCRREFDTVGECSLHEKECSGMMEFDASGFKRESCPEWARYAVVDRFGIVVFSSMPRRFGGGDWVMNYPDNRVFRDCYGEKVFLRDFGKLMLTRYPEGYRKDDVKDGDWIWCESTSRYLKVESMDGTLRTSEGISLRATSFSKAKRVPYTPEQMERLVGKVVKSSNKVALVLECNMDYGVRIGDNWFTAEELLWGITFVDSGLPTCVLLHYDDFKKEWVK